MGVSDSGERVSFGTGIVMGCSAKSSCSDAEGECLGGPDSGEARSESVR